MQIQIGTTRLPILIKPRVDGIVRSVSWIKANQSHLYENDTDTPMIFTLEYKKRGDESPTELEADTVQSTNDILVFEVPDEFYAEAVKWSIMISWKVTKEQLPDPPLIEKVYIENPISFEIKDLNNI